MVLCELIEKYQLQDKNAPIARGIFCKYADETLDCNDFNGDCTGTDDD